MKDIMLRLFDNTILHYKEMIKGSTKTKLWKNTTKIFHANEQSEVVIKKKRLCATVCNHLTASSPFVFSKYRYSYRNVF